MTARSQRRAEERKRKKALKPAAVDSTKTMDSTKVAMASPTLPVAANRFPAIPQHADDKPEAAPTTEPRPTPTPAQRAANQQNAQHSTGPRTAEGKSASSRNRSTHGLTGGMFYLLSYESQAEYDALEAEFLAEYAPASLTETLLVRTITQSWWLRQRAQLMTDMTIPESTGTNCVELLPLYMRYQAHHDRAFHKALAELLKLRAEQRRTEAARQKSGQVEILFSQKAEYHALRIHALRLKLKKEEPTNAKPTPVTEIGFVSQSAFKPPVATSIDSKIQAQEAAA